MIYILVQANESPQSLVALKLLKETVECTFNILLDGPWLRPMLFGSQSNQTFVEHYYSFVGEVSCGRWEIFCCRKNCCGKQYTRSTVVSQLKKY